MKVKFGDVVKDVKSNVDRANNPYEFYVAGDHMDTEDFRIHRRGSFATDDVGPAFVRIFHPGQVLYGSRRTYLKKVCVADFDGICANTTFVLETKDEGVLTQRLLPFLMLSDGFTDWSIKHSKGSTNPYILFSDLANYEFSLPPIDRQRELADLLWAANDLKEAYKKAISATDEMLKAKFREMFGDESAVRQASKVNLLKAGECKNGLNFASNESGHTVKCVGVSDFSDDGKLIDLSKVAFVSVSEMPPKTMMLHDKDFVFVRSNGNKVLVGRCKMVMPGQDKVTFGGFCIRYRLAEKRILHDWLAYFLRSDKVRQSLQGRGAGGSIHNLSRSILSQIDVPVFPLPLQREFVAIAEAAEETKAALKRSLADLEQVMKGLING